jgi:hypothetical protein
MDIVTQQQNTAPPSIVITTQDGKPSAARV